jgi:hypothetical protein
MNPLKLQRYIVRFVGEFVVNFYMEADCGYEFEMEFNLLKVLIKS